MSKLTATEWIWRDGEFVRWDDARIHLLSHSVQYGSSVFEGIRCYDTPHGPAVFRLREHIDRLFGSCKIYRMELRFTPDQLISACCELIERNGLRSCYLRPMVLRGYGSTGMVPFDSPVEVFLPCWPEGPYLGPDALERGVDICVSSWHRVAPNTVPSMAKMAGNYLSGMLVKMEALENGYDEAVALGPDGLLSEGSGQNAFLIQGGVLRTTPLAGTILHGITRDAVLTLAADAGIPVREEPLPREMLYLADEVFLCGTASEITPVRSVDRRPVGRGEPGPVTRRLQRLLLDTAQGKAPDRHGWLTYVRGVPEPALARERDAAGR